MTPPQFTRGRDSATQHKIDLAFDLVDYVFDKVELKDKYMDSKIRVVQRLVYRDPLENPYSTIFGTLLRKILFSFLKY